MYLHVNQFVSLFGKELSGPLKILLFTVEMHSVQLWAAHSELYDTNSMGK